MWDDHKETDNRNLRIFSIEENRVSLRSSLNVKWGEKTIYNLILCSAPMKQQMPDLFFILISVIIYLLVGRG